jgi:hypothetical protein
VNRTKVAVILGSGRSMTSGVAKGLHMAGFPMAKTGDPMVDASPSNPKGHYEDRRLVDLNDRILRQLGYTWDDPPPLYVPGLWSQAVDDFTPAARDYLEYRAQEGQFGMKDPRCTVIWPVWAEAFKQVPYLEPILVAVQRDTAATSESLATRDHLDTEVARAIVETYQERTQLIVSNAWPAYIPYEPF